MNRIRELREKQGLSVRALEKKSGVSFMSIYSYEHERTMPRVDLAYYLAQVLGVSIEYMMGWKDED